MDKITLKNAKYKESSVELFIQDFFTPESILYDTLVSSFSKSTYGIGVYAFASSSGVETLFEAEEFCDFIKSRKYKLVIGMDAITDSRCISLLNKYCKMYSNLKVYAYINDRSAAIMHTKFSWFKAKRNGRLVLGSGNLTLAGLRFNTEAYVVCSTHPIDSVRIQSEIDNWFSNSKPFLYDIDNLKVIERASENDKVNKVIRKITPRAKAVGEEKVIIESESNDDSKAYEEWMFDSSADILIAEIPKSGNRWKQVNFNKEVYESFFGASEHTSSSFILLKSVLSDGNLGEIERRPNIKVISSNYRFEFSQAEGDYPTNGRPLVIVSKIGLSTFIYEIVKPGSYYYNEVLLFLDGNLTSQKNKMRRIVFKANTIKNKLPNLKINKYLRK